jgi:uncharacterized membrane protein YgcG
MLVIPVTVHADNGYVKDDANVLSSQTQQKISDLNTTQLQKLKQNPQLVVMTVKSLHGKSVEQAANAQFEKYHFGNSQYNNGVLIYVAINDHKVRVATGSGLDDKMPNGDIDKILTDDVKEDMQDNDYNAGILLMAQNATKQLRLLYDSAYASSVKQASADQLAAFKTEQHNLFKSFMGFLGIVIGIMVVTGLMLTFISYRKFRLAKSRFDAFKEKHLPELYIQWHTNRATVEKRLNELWSYTDFDDCTEPSNYYRTVNTYSYADSTDQSFEDAENEISQLFEVSRTLSHEDPKNEHPIGNSVLNSPKFVLEKYTDDLNFWKERQEVANREFKTYVDSLDPDEVTKRLNKEKGLDVSKREVTEQLAEMRDSNFLRHASYQDYDDYSTNNMLFNMMVFSMLADNFSEHDDYDSSSSYDSSDSYSSSDFGGGGGGFDGGGGSGGW